MQKKTGAILLVAGTCLGSGMIALPMVFAKLGLVPSIALMLIIWSVVYYTSLVSVELNLQAGHGESLGNLGKRFSGRGAEFLGTACLKLLSYSLLAVYIYGGSSVMQSLVDSKFDIVSIASCYALITVGMLMLPIKFVDYINRFLFVGLLIVVAILVAGLVTMINWNNLPLFSENYLEISIWIGLIPVVFTSFGFQVIFHTLTNYCQKNIKVLKGAFFWGSLIPAIVYIIWTCSVIGVVYNGNPSFYQLMIDGNVEVGDLVKELSRIAKWQSVQLLIWWISLLAIVTSVIGVGFGLCDSLKTMLADKILNSKLRNLTASILTVLPAYVVAILVPNAFIPVLGFAGMILAIIAILLPIYLLNKIKIKKFHYSELRHVELLIGSFLVGLAIITCEIINIINR